MAVLNLAIGKSKYTVHCEDGEEEKVLELAAVLNERVNHMSFALRGTDEKTILVLSALEICDELENVKNGGDSESLSPKKISKIVEERVIEEIGEVAERIIGLTKKIEEL